MAHKNGHDSQFTGAVPRTVLLVEDESDIRDLLHLVLTEAGYVVTTATTGQEAVAALADVAFTVVVTDYHLPDITGVGVVQAARQCVCPSLVVLMSGDPAIAAYAAVVQADGWFRKGDPLAELLARIARLLEERP